MGREGDLMVFIGDVLYADKMLIALKRLVLSVRICYCK
ncbi:MAG: hypothetical protein PWP51_281 [Clostridiales bacterium]|jgi:hypothetical protein|nr:hypothetical protein [Clostridiales bacterium]MDN5297728.1 hypothetical protein [Clostridiales bacterium]